MNASRLLAAALLFCARLVLADTPAADQPLRAAVQKSLTYLADEGRDWMESRSCVTCHHAAMMIWSLEHAKLRGFEIDEKTLTDVVAWTLAPKTKLLSPPPAPGAKIAVGMDTLQSMAAYYTLATDVPETSPVPAEMHTKLVQHLLDKQNADGSWTSFSVQPPMLHGGEGTTLYVLLSLLGKDGKGEPIAPDWPERKARALSYLAKAAPSDEVETKLWRLLLRQQLAASNAAASLIGSQGTDAAAIRSQQHPDGGWGQNPALPSDALATGQVLYYLDATHTPLAPEARDKAIAFLLKTQQPDGTWPIKPRPRTAPKADAGAKDASVIGYVGTAWATMGLVSAAGR